MVSSDRKLKRCFLVQYSYHDYELQEKHIEEHYVRDLREARDLLDEFNQYNMIIEADIHGSRSETKIVIKEVYLPERKYFIFFNS